MFETSIRNSLNEPDEICTRLVAFFSQGTLNVNEAQELNALVRLLYSHTDNLDLYIKHCFSIPKAIGALNPSAHRLSVMVTFLSSVLMDELDWIKETVAMLGPISSNPELHHIALVQYQARIAPNPELLRANFMNTLLALIMIQIFMRRLNISLKPEDVRLLLELDEALQACLVSCHLFFNSLPPNFIHQMSSEISPLFQEISVQAKLKFMPGLSTMELYPLLSIAEILENNVIINECHAAFLKQKLASAQSFQDISELLITFITMDEKPLIYIYKYHNILIKLGVGFMCHTADFNVRLRQLVLLTNGLRSERFQTPVLACFMFEFYVDNFGFGIPEAAETARHFLINTFVGSHCPDVTELEDAFAESIIQKNHFDVAIAHCIAQMPSSMFTKTNKRQFYDYMMDGYDSTASFTDALWRIVQEKNFPYLFFKKFKILYSSLLISIHTEYHEPLLRLARAVSALRKKYDPIAAKLNPLDSEKHNIYCHLLYTDIERTFKPLDIMMMLKSCPESEVDVFLRYLTNTAILVDVFKPLYFHNKKGGDIAGEFYKADYIIRLSKAVNQLKSYAMPELSLELEFAKPLDIRANVNVLLMLLVLVSKKLKNATIIPHQDAWIRLSLAFIKQVVLKGKGSFFEKLMTDSIDTFDIHSLLPSSQQQAFLDVLSQAKQDWSLDDDHIQFLDRTLSTPDKLSSSKKNKKNKKAPAKLQDERADFFDHTDEASTSAITCTSPDSVISDSALLSTIPHQVLVSDPELLVFDDEEHLSSSDEGLSDGEGHIDGQLIIPLFLTPADRFYKHLKSPLKKISDLLRYMQSIELPIVWQGLVAEVNAGVRSLLTLINQDESTNATDNEELQDAASYALMDRSQQLLLEKTWNIGLAFFCWDVQCAHQKYLQSVTTDKPIDEVTRINSVTRAALLSLSFCYFRNMLLHLNHDILVQLEAIALYLRGKDFDLSIKGAFVFPDKIRDLDLFVTPRLENKMIDKPNKIVNDLLQQFSSHLVSGSIFQNADIWSQQMYLKLDELRGIDIDFIFSLQHLSAEQTLASTLTSILSTTSVLWSINGAACMIPMAARANCGSKRVLRPIIEIRTDAHWLQISGYLVKQLIKMSQDLCLSPELVQFSNLYLNPTTRYAANPQAVEELVGLNRRMIAEVLGYLLSRFTTRTHQSIQFIVDKQLLECLFSLTAASSELCSVYFISHFIPQEGEFQPTLSSPAFLAMFLLGGIIDQLPDSKVQLFLCLEQSLVFCNDSLKKMIISTMSILKKLPLSTIDFYVENKSPVSTGEGITFADRAAQVVLKSWHRKTGSTIDVESNSAEAATSDVRKKASLEKLGGISQFFRPAPQGTASVAGALHAATI